MKTPKEKKEQAERIWGLSVLLSLYEDRNNPDVGGGYGRTIEPIEKGNHRIHAAVVSIEPFYGGKLPIGDGGWRCWIDLLRFSRAGHEVVDYSAYDDKPSPDWVKLFDVVRAFDKWAQREYHRLMSEAVVVEVMRSIAEVLTAPETLGEVVNDVWLEIQYQLLRQIAPEECSELTSRYFQEEKPR